MEFCSSTSNLFRSIVNLLNLFCVNFYHLVEIMNNHVGVGTARGANLMIFRIGFRLVKRKMKQLQDALFPITEKEKIMVEVNNVPPIMHDHALVNMNEPVFPFVENKNLMKVSLGKESIWAKKKRSSWKPNKRNDPIFMFILHLFYFNLFKTDKNLNIPQWMISLLEVEDLTSTIDEDTDE